MKALISIVETIALFLTAVLALSWVNDPSGNYEPWIVFLGLIFIASDIIRRKFSANSQAVFDFANWYENSNRLRTQVASIPFFGKLLHEYLMQKAIRNRVKTTNNPDNKLYLDRLNQAFKVDSFLLKQTRSINFQTPKELLNKSYKMMLEGNSKEFEVDMYETLSYLESKNTSPLIRSIPPKAKLLLDCGALSNNNISKLQFLSEGNEIIPSISNSPLLWPCNCKVKEHSITTKKQEIDENDCPLHSIDVDRKASSLFGEEIVQISFDGVSVMWKQSDDIWPPSIDAFHLVQDIKKSGIVTNETKSVLDIGCGTGFIGIWLAKKYKSVNDISFSDWLLSPLMMTALNASLSLDDTLVRRHYYIGLGFEWVNKKHREPMRDLLICNPPYLPSLEGHSQIPMASTVFGTDLIDDVIRHGHKYAKEVIISFSSLADLEAKQSAIKWKKKLVPVGDPHRVPFRISHVYDQHEYINELIQDRGLEFTPLEIFPMHHYLQTFRVIENER